MEVNLLDELKPQSSSASMLDVSGDILMEMQELVNSREENKNFLRNTPSAISLNNDDSGLLFASLPKAEVKLKKLDESKLLMDNNENSLSVDTLIEILSSSNETTTKPLIENIKSDSKNNIDDNMNVPPPFALDSPSPSSSHSKTDNLSSPPPTTASETSSPKSNTPHTKKFPSPHYPNGGKPMIADLNKKMKQFSRRQPKPKAVYQSQISDNSVGIKLCIKKSVDTFKSSPSSNSNNANSTKTPRKRSRKSNKTTAKTEKKGSESDDPYVKRRKKQSSATNSSSNSSKGSPQEPVEQTVWGKAIPREILLDVSCLITILFTHSLFKSYNFRFSRWLSKRKDQYRWQAD